MALDGYNMFNCWLTATLIFYKPNSRIFAARYLYRMWSITTRLIILTASILIAVIIGMQVHWLNKNYALEKHEFNTSVLKAIRGVYEDLPLLYNSSISLDSLAEKYNENTFLFQVDSIPEKDTLIAHLSNELEDFQVFTDCRIAQYDKATGKYAYQYYLSADASKADEDTISALPLISRGFSYIHLNFPHREKYIINQMKSWIFTSAILLLLLIAFSFSIYYFLKQKFLVEIQKDFINNVTHEFSTPLSVIDLSIEGLEKSSTLTNPERHQKYVSSIKYQAEYLKKHIANLVNTVVADQYHLPLKKQPYHPTNC